MKPRTRTAPSTRSGHVHADALARWASDCLRAVGMPAGDATLVARSLVQTSLWGVDSHGVARLGHYLSRITAGSIEPRPRIKVTRSAAACVQVDGAHGHGIVVCHRAMAEAIRIASKKGIGAAGVSNSSHCGAIGLYGRQAAHSGMIGIAFTHSDAFVAPHGGKAKFLGTNPICITVPTMDPDRPLCLDMATSAVPYNKVLNCRRENKPLEAGWAFDARGRPTTDAHKAACLLPLAGHKGYALAFMIDLLCGPLNGMPFGPHIPAMYAHLDRRRTLGSFFIAVDPGVFGDRQTLMRTAGRMAREARAQPRLHRSKPILAPGDPELASAKRRFVTGIPVEPGLRAEMAGWSTRLGVVPPWED